MDVDLTGLVVQAGRWDGTTLYVELVGGWLVVVENDHELRRPDGSVLRTADGDEARMVSLLTAEVGTPLTSFTCTADGHLAFAVAAGEVRVAPLEGFETWHVVGPRGERVISIPGGELAIWSARPEP